MIFSTVRNYIGVPRFSMPIKGYGVDMFAVEEFIVRGAKTAPKQWTCFTSNDQDWWQTPFTMFAQRESPMISSLESCTPFYTHSTVGLSRSSASSKDSKAGRSGLHRHEIEQLDLSYQLSQKGPNQSSRRRSLLVQAHQVSPKPLERNSDYPLVPETPKWHNETLTVGKDDSFQFLIEVQDHENHALQQPFGQQQQDVSALTLPQPSLQVFSGDPIDHCDFVHTFEHLVERKTKNRIPF